MLLAGHYGNEGCDGLFLPLVDNFGVRLPIASIVPAIQRAGSVRFVVRDATQAFNYVDVSDCVRACDFVIGGCHKWLRAYARAIVERLLPRAYRRLVTTEEVAQVTQLIDRELESDPDFHDALRICERLERHHNEPTCPQTTIVETLRRISFLPQDP